MATGAKVTGGVIFAGAGKSKTSLSLVHFRLSLLRPHPVGPLHSLPLPHAAANFLKFGHCNKNSRDKNYPRPCKLRALLGDGSLHLHDAGATALVVTGAYALVSAFDKLTYSNLIQQSLSRKLVHILSGLLFMASWPIFRELLRGPLYYVIILILCAIFFWRDSPVGVISVSMMCGGDGIADIMGRRFGSMKLPYNQQKSWAGSISMFVFGFLISTGMLYYFSALGYFHLEWSCTMQRVALVSLVATLVESLPITGLVDDNISVPLASMELTPSVLGSYDISCFSSFFR